MNKHFTVVMCELFISYIFVTALKNYEQLVLHNTICFLFTTAILFVFVFVFVYIFHLFLFTGILFVCILLTQVLLILVMYLRLNILLFFGKNLYFFLLT